MNSAELSPAPDLDAMAARCDRATPPPWYMPDTGYRHYVCDGRGRRLVTIDGYDKDDGPNGEFIAAARQDVPTLIAALRAERARVAAVEASVQTLLKAFEGIIAEGEHYHEWAPPERLHGECHFCHALGANLPMIHGEFCPVAVARQMLAGAHAMQPEADGALAARLADATEVLTLAVGVLKQATPLKWVTNHDAMAAEQWERFQRDDILQRLNRPDLSEVYEVRVQLDQKVYVSGTLAECVRHAFREGYKRAQEDDRHELRRALTAAQGERDQMRTILARLVEHQGLGFTSSGYDCEDGPCWYCDEREHSRTCTVKQAAELLAARPAPEGNTTDDTR